MNQTKYIKLKEDHLFFNMGIPYKVLGLRTITDQGIQIHFYKVIDDKGNLRHLSVFKCEVVSVKKQYPIP